MIDEILIPKNVDEACVICKNIVMLYHNKMDTKKHVVSYTRRDYLHNMLIDFFENEKEHFVNNYINDNTIIFMKANVYLHKVNQNGIIYEFKITFPCNFTVIFNLDNYIEFNREQKLNYILEL